MVEDAPRWREILPAILNFASGDIVVAHNAGFDIGVIRYACAADNIEWPELRFLCTLVLSRRALALPTYRLPYVAEHLGHNLREHHDALADARAVVAVVRELAHRHEANTLEDLATAVGVYLGRMQSGIYKGSVAVSGASALSRADLNPDADESGYLYGRSVVFSGTLMSMTRQIAWDECSRVGAIAEKAVTKRTNVLVVGDINPAQLRPGSHVTGKARRAFELQDKGQHIEVMTEDDFLRCLEGKPLDGAGALLNPGGDTELRPVAPREGMRSVPILERPAPALPKPPKPLRRTPVETDQPCSVGWCAERAAFKTRTKATWCAAHIAEIQRKGGLKPLDAFTHPDDWQLTECLTCGVEAHYRFSYTLEKNGHNEQTCRACFWRNWASQARALRGPWAEAMPVPYEEACSVIEQNGYDYLGPLSSPSYREDPHHTKCRRCGKISVKRLSDVEFGCTCRPRQ